MNRCLIAVCLLFAAGCVVEPGEARRSPAKPGEATRVVVVSPEFPQANLPVESRQRNWVQYQSGSCGCASTISALRWNGLARKSEEFRSICGGGQSDMSLCQKLDRIGVRYTEGGMAVLEWAAKTRRAAVIGFKSRHICTLIGKQGDNWLVLDNNSVGRPEAYSPERFRQLWHGWAIVPLGTPAPPL